jgi:hypothetical protein
MVLPFLSQAGTTAANAADMPAVGADTQQANSLAELTRLLGGDLSASLTGGDKLLALSALMRSATRSGRRAGLTPQQVMGQLQQQKVAEMQNRMALQQMQQQKQFRNQFLATLPENERQFARILPDAQLAEYVMKRNAGPELTSFAKDLRMRNIDINSLQGQELYAQYIKNKIDPIIEMDTPSGKKFVGRESEYFRRFGGGAPSPTVPAPKTKQEYDALPPGTEFIDPNGTRRTKPGGQTGATAPSGGFR